MENRSDENKTENHLQLICWFYNTLYYLMFSRGSCYTFADILFRLFNLILIIFFLSVHFSFGVALHTMKTQTVRSLGERDFDCWHVQNNNRKQLSFSLYRRRCCCCIPNMKLTDCVLYYTTCYLMTSFLSSFFLSFCLSFCRSSIHSFGRSSCWLARSLIGSSVLCVSSRRRTSMW